MKEKRWASIIFYVILMELIPLTHAQIGNNTDLVTMNRIDDCLKLAVKSDTEIEYIKQTLFQRENIATHIEESYYEAVKNIQTWILIVGGLLAFILAFAVYWGIKDMQSIKKNANDIAKEEATNTAKNIAKIVAKEESQAIVNELIKKIYTDEYLKKLNDKVSTLEMQLQDLTDTTKVLNKRVDDSSVQKTELREPIKEIKDGTKKKTQEKKKITFD